MDINIIPMKQNETMINFLRQHGFDYDTLIGKIYHGASHGYVFLELCYNGNVQCMDYLISQYKDNIDIWQRNIYGYNGLHIAINEENVQMVQY